MSGSVADLLRELRDHGAETKHQSTRGTVEGWPVIYRRRWITIPHDDGELPHIVATYDTWPPDGTYTVHAYFGVHTNDEDRLLMPVGSLAEVWQLWMDIKACLARPPRSAREAVEPLGQLDMLDLLAGAR